MNQQWMNRGCCTFDQLQTCYQLIRLIEIHWFHVLAHRIHLPNIVFGDLYRVVDQSPEYGNFLGQIGTEVRTNCLNSKLGANALNSILFTCLREFIWDEFRSILFISTNSTYRVVSFRTIIQVFIDDRRSAWSSQHRSIAASRPIAAFALQRQRQHAVVWIRTDSICVAHVEFVNRLRREHLREGNLRRNCRSRRRCIACMINLQFLVCIRSHSSAMCINS